MISTDTNTRDCDFLTNNLASLFLLIIIGVILEVRGVLFGARCLHLLRVITKKDNFIDEYHKNCSHYSVSTKK